MKHPLISSAKSILIYGYGLSGKSSEQFLRNHTQAQIHIYDANKPEYAQEPKYSDHEIIVISPGIPRTNIPEIFHDRVKTNTDIFFELLTEDQKRKVIGITGTKGKSTTTKFMHEVLQAAGYRSAIAGNYGVPFLDIYDDIDQYDFIVAELSSYQLEHLQVSPHYAICTNLFQDHLDRHGTRQAYHAAKANLWMHQHPEAHAFFPIDHKSDFQPLMPDSQVHWCSTLSPKTIDPINSMHASHMLQNFGLVKTLSEHLDIYHDIVEKVFENFEGLPHRMQKIAEVNGRIFVDDSISTTPESALAVVRFYGQKLKVLLLGGKDRDQAFETLFVEIKKIAPQTLIGVLPSETAPEIYKALQKTNWPEGQIFAATDMSDAVHKSYNVMNETDVCVLSPAAPSYDRYKNYKERGNEFRDATQKIEI